MWPEIFSFLPCQPKWLHVGGLITCVALVSVTYRINFPALLAFGLTLLGNHHWRSLFQQSKDLRHWIQTLYILNFLVSNLTWNLKVWGSLPHVDSEFFSLFHVYDKDEKNILLFFFTKLKAYHLSILSTNITLSTLLILAVCRKRVIWSIRARNLKVWGLIPHGDSDLFFFVPLLWQDGKKNIFL